MRLWLRFRRDELSDEIRVHREMLEEQFIAEGMPPAEAASTARAQFGNEVSTLEQSRDQWGFEWLYAALRDVRFAWRLLKSRPMLTLTTVLIAGLGVGANTAIVSVLETVILHPLGMLHSGRVFVASVRIDKINLTHAETSGVEYRELRSMTDVFHSVAAQEGRSWTIQSGGEPHRLRGRAVTPDFFRVFGELPALGRFFAPEDRQCLVVSWAFWKKQYGGDRGIIGRTVMLDNNPYRVVGVAGEHFRYPVDADAWSSLELSPARLRDRGDNMTLTLLARLNDNATPAQALDRVNSRVAAFKATPEGREMSNYGYFIDLEPFAQFIAGDLRRPLWLLWAAASAVLFTACANIAVLLLSRTAGRRREIAIRLSLGATRSQILRQLLLESLLSGTMGGIFGMAVGAGAIALLGYVNIPEKRMLELVALNWRIMLYGMSLSLASGLIFGLGPAIQLLRNQSASMGRGVRHRFQHMFIAGQIAAALVLLIATGLLLRSLWTIESIHPGFDPLNVTTALLIKPGSDPGFLDRLEQKLRAGPGVEASALAYPIPFSGGGLTSGFDIAGRQQHTHGVAWHGEAWFVSPGYLTALRIPLLSGRNFTDADTMAAPHVCLIDKKFADRFFSNEDPIGHKIGMYGLARIVGVVANVRSSTLEEESRAGVYYAIAQQAAFPYRGMIVRSQLPAAGIIRAAVYQTNAAVPVFDIQTMQQRIDESLGIRRILATLVTAFAAICILLATIGLHGVVSQIVGERSAEIAVRMALGAQPARILRHFLHYGLRAGFAGIAIGAALSIYTQKWLRSFLFGVAPFDTVTFCMACAGALIVLSAATFWPAWRASRIQPQSLLRHE